MESPMPAIYESYCNPTSDIGDEYVFPGIDLDTITYTQIVNTEKFYKALWRKHDEDMHHD